MTLANNAFEQSTGSHSLAAAVQRERWSTTRELMTPRSKSWQELVARYGEYRSLPVWGTMVRVPDPSGRLRKDHIEAIALRGRRAAMRVSKALPALEKRCGPAWPTSPLDLIDRQ